jgi:hypothetical protein
MSSSSAPESELFGPRIRAPAEAPCPWDVVIRVSTFGNAYLLNAFRAVSKSAQNEMSRIVDERLLPEHRRLAQSLVRRTLRRSALRRASTAPDLEDGAAGAAGAADDALSSALNSADFVESLRRAATMPMLRSVELLGARPAISRVSLALLSLRSDDAAGSPSEAVGLAADGAFCDLVDAVRRDDGAAVEALVLDKGAAVDHRPRDGRYPCLHQAAMDGRAVAVAALLRLGAAATVVADNQLALNLAACYGREAAVRAFLEHAPDVLDLQDDFGATALATATFYSQAPIVEVLLDAGADATVPSTLGKTPLDIVRGRLELPDARRELHDAREHIRDLLERDRARRLGAAPECKSE